MPTIEYWIQLENHPWDACPKNIDRMTGRNIQEIHGTAPVLVTLTSPITGVSRSRTMFFPLRNEDGSIEDALILRRYTANWAAPADQKVNPWDLNEPDPTDNGTMGTIPGPTLECSVGDNVIVHFRNMDTRFGKELLSKTHSLHPHGFVFANTHDGAYPLSPPDTSQPVGSESAAWTTVGVSDFKKGDRVPPTATFDYNWHTLGWPTTAGVWLYHDHSVCDTHNVELGAIGTIVIHNALDPNDILDPDLPNNSHIGSPVDSISPTPTFIAPPAQATYLQLFHNLEPSGGMCINGRKYMGNTPTMVAGENTKMRFGVVGMGNVDGFHTFHIHGHRWIIPGPDGNTSDVIQNSLQTAAASQFEDTRTFGPANSFSFTANPGSFMRALPPGLGEWHMHCHVLTHMMHGMMGTLLIIQGGEQALPLPMGVLCPDMAGGHNGGHGGGPTTIVVKNFQFTPNSMTVASGTEIAFNFQESNHTVVTSAHPGASQITINNGGGDFDGVPVGQIRKVIVTGSSGGMIQYNCGIHGPSMDGTITIS
jgi:plastocyanin